MKLILSSIRHFLFENQNGKKTRTWSGNLKRQLEAETQSGKKQQITERNQPNSVLSIQFGKFTFVFIQTSKGISIVLIYARKLFILSIFILCDWNKTNKQLILIKVHLISFIFIISSIISIFASFSWFFFVTLCIFIFVDKIHYNNVYIMFSCH